MDPTLANLIQIICAFGWRDAEDVLPESTFSDLSFDTLHHIALIHDVEDAFEITLTDEEALSATTVSILYQLILSKF